jgi:hypothetical protein
MKAVSQGRGKNLLLLASRVTKLLSPPAPANFPVRELRVPLRGVFGEYRER